jgi:hypothetical protein
MDPHTLQNDAQPLSDDMTILQQVMAITLKKCASPPALIKPMRFFPGQPLYMQDIEILDTIENVKPVYYNHWYDNALVIDSILLGGCEYYTLSRDYLGNFVIDLEIDETLVERSPTDESDGK